MIFPAGRTIDQKTAREEEEEEEEGEATFHRDFSFVSPKARKGLSSAGLGRAETLFVPLGLSNWKGDLSPVP